ncbi:hypothetical protein MLD38_030232 [Melastoma candidum]|uniref:Uncharacterized protein n=1 Tax=Melastoma candidum TaxID=119954 RepID=A0ACB9MMA2_9MYRT|nr:hypothetical protein MLD38_030232 [Melastoma candidum]
MFPLVCGGSLDLASPCIRRWAVDIVNLFFLCCFYSSLLFAALKKEKKVGGTVLQRDRKGMVTVVVSVCCVAACVFYLGTAVWDLEEGSEGNEPGSWLVGLVRAAIWLSLTVTLLVDKPGWIWNFVCVWWVCFCFMVTALNAEALIRGGLDIGLPEIVTWPLSYLLLFCAIRGCISRDRDSGDEKLREPILPEKELGKRRVSGLGHAGFFSRLIFAWINPLLRLGCSKTLELDDIPSLVSEDEAHLAYEKFSQAWESVLKDKGPKANKNLVIRALARVYFKENVFVAFCAFLRMVSVVLSPLLLYWFVEYSNRGGDDRSEGITIVGWLILAKVVESFSQRHWFFIARRSGMMMRSALMVAVYEKQLKLSSIGRRSHSTGEIVNYIAVDAYRMGEFPWWLHTTWSLVLQLFTAIGVLFSVIGVGALPGLVPLLACGLLNLPFAKILQTCQSQLMIAQDERLRSTSEILNSMKIIKLQSWESKFRSVIESHRETEMKWLAKAQFKKPYTAMLFWISPTVISSVVFVGCVLLGSAPLNASTIFTILASLRSMAEPVRMIPEALSNLIQVKVSTDRINKFLLDDELRPDRVTRSAWSDSPVSLKITSGDFSWDITSTSVTLQDIDLEAKHGQKIAVCGPVGAGKSSLLFALLGEISRTRGMVNLFGSVAYVAQNSWIQSGTIRDNVLFGKPMDEDKYERAIKACALDKDINNFSHGDLTEIGQRGINMSGGQKQRIQLARAVYSDADIYLLDDPFSAVDAQTASILFNDCVMTALETKTVVLVTHQVEFLSAVEKILVMQDGRITQSGSYQELLTAGTPFEKLVNAHKDALSTTLGSPNADTEDREECPDRSDLAEEKNSIEISEMGPPGVQLTEAEEKEMGNLGLKPIRDYLCSSNALTLLILSTLCQLVFVVLQATSTYWLALAVQLPGVTDGALIGVFTVISTLSAVFVFFRQLFGAHMGIKASKAFFSSFTDAIFRAPMLFFDSTPVGRILTRASSDFSILDFDIPFAIVYVISAGTELLAALAVMASVTWQVLVVAIFAMVSSKYIQEYYFKSARELIRINGTTKAPVMNYAAETSLGAITIRAFNSADRFSNNFLSVVDADSKLFFHSNAMMEWLSLRVESLQNLNLFTAAIFLLLLPKGTVPPGLIGLSLSYALTVSAAHVFVTRWFGYLLNYIISVERIKQFMHIPSEPAAIVENHRPPSSWPSKGRIELEDLHIRYRPNAPLVLKGITCTFREGSRVGVVGRTGSGKSTLISALFRLVEPASGRIFIDGLDITSIGLKDLRMKLGIIPQEPTLFRGTVRTNIDPLGVYSDPDIWSALEKCQLKDTISSLPNQLDSPVTDEGENWSAGQRQLFCLGRVLLRRNRILVLDEATASIDSTTDATLQRIIRQEFEDCTVVTVAHRVPTVIDSDMVLVLSYGNLVEYEEPAKLMETKNSSFSKLVAEYWSSCKKGSE